MIRQADKREYEKVIDFYFYVIDKMENAEFSPGWIKGIYPEEKYIMESINCKNLYLNIKNDVICGAMILNNENNDGYLKVKWNITAEKDEVFVIHALCSNPDFAGKGYAKELVLFALEKAEKENKKAVRLDVLNGNIPALRLYENLGFKYIDTVNMFYEDTGYTDYILYEYEV